MTASRHRTCHEQVEHALPAMSHSFWQRRASCVARRNAPVCVWPRRGPHGCYVPCMLAKVIGFHQDDDGVWVADLGCGHCQHVRHNPPWQLREWVTTEAGRSAMLGTTLDCPYCNMAVVPDGVVPYKRTATFTEETVPAALLHDHRMKPGTWAHVVVEEGKLEYTCDRGTFFLKPGIQGVIEPEVPHHVRLLGRVRFHVVFLRAGAGST